MKVTQAMLARVLGVSQMTVSIALSGAAGRVSEETRRRVLAKAEELGYQPHAAARAMKRGRFDCVAYVSSAEGHSFGGHGPIQGALQALLPQGMNLMLTELSEAKLANDGYVPRILQELSVDGLLINYVLRVPEPMRQVIEHNRVPAIWLNTQLERNCIHPDWFEAGRQLVHVLAAAGHRRIAFGTMQQSPVFSISERFAGYLQGMRERGLPPLHAPTGGDFNHWTRQLIASDQPPSALMVYGPEARWAYAAAQAAAVRVPQDLSIVAFATREEETDGRIPIATMSMSMIELGQRAVELLLQRIAEPGTELPALQLPLAFSPGGTFAARSD